MSILVIIPIRTDTNVRADILHPIAISAHCCEIRLNMQLSKFCEFYELVSIHYSIIYYTKFLCPFFRRQYL